MIDITTIISAIITFIFAAISIFLLPWLKEKYSAEKLSRTYSIVQMAVEAAEQIYTASGVGTHKKNYVLNYLNSIGITYDAETIDNMIESAVKNLEI